MKGVKVFEFLKRFKKRNSVSYDWSLKNIYTPSFSFNANASIYENAQIRAIINTIASDCSKAQFKLTSENKNIDYLLRHKPNEFLSSSQFIKRVVTMYLVDNNVFLIPIKNEYGEVLGVYPVSNDKVTIKKYKGRVLVVVQIDDYKMIFDYNEIGHLKRMKYKNDFYGEVNNLKETMCLIDLNEQATKNAIENSAVISYVGQLANQVLDDDLKNARDEFVKINLSKDNKTQMLIYDKKFEKVERVKYEGIFLDEKQKAVIEDNLQNYFNVSSKAIKHEFSNEYEATSYYEGVIEPILIEFSEQISNVFYSKKEIIDGNYIYLSANRMQFADSKTKLEYSTSLFDRGILSANDVCDVWQLPHFKDGDKRYIRLEYGEKGAIKNEAE